MKKIVSTLCYLLLINTLVLAQETPSSTENKQDEKGQFSGNFQTTNQFYVKDSAIGANTTQYEKELSSTDAWLFLNYKVKGFNFSLRYDLFNNTPLFDPFIAYTGSGIGFWQVSKDVDKFNFTVGNFYDQFGTGMVFRAYEDRNIGIDFAILGARVIYTPTENTRIKAFTGQQKFRFDRKTPVIKGINAEHRFELGSSLNSEIGASLVNRTIDQATMNTIAATINSYPLEQRFDPTYNVFITNIYNTLNYKRFTLYLEYARKSAEAIMGQDFRMFKKGGNIYYTSLSYSAKGIGINAQYKRIDHFPFRASPLEVSAFPSNQALINYLPSLTRQNTYRLLARYNAVVQELGENAMQLEVTLKPTKKLQINLNTSIVTTLKGVDFEKGFSAYNWDTTTRLFREYYVDASYKVNTKLKVMGGVQFIGYNQTTFELKPNAPFVEAITPFGEVTYKLNKQQSIRVEGQYLITEQDLGHLVNALVEFNIAPHWSFSVADMVNTKHGSLNKPAAGEKFDLIHYYNFFGSYTYKTTRITAAWLKQVAGVNCTGGVCRVEPAFSGARVTLSTNF